MHRMLRFFVSTTLFALSGVLVAPAGCSGGAGAPGSSCSNDGACGSGSFCMQNGDFPEGYCSKSCKLDDPSTCPSGSVCIDDASGAPAGVKSVCYESCKVDGDCGRAGYVCREKASQLVCRKA